MSCVILDGRVWDFDPKDGMVTVPLHVGCAVHTDIEKIPSAAEMAFCEPEDDVVIVACGQGLHGCEACFGTLSEYLCDFPMGDGKTCSLPLCPDCRIRQPKVGRVRLDFCPAHDALLRARGQR